MTDEIDGLSFEIDYNGAALVDGQRYMGHPIHLTDEIIDKIISLVEKGNYLQVAFAAAGVRSGSYTKWRRQAESVSQRYPDLDIDDYPENMIPPEVTPAEWQAFKLCQKMEFAEGRAEAFAVLAVRKHMPDQWTAAMTFLERRHPDRWRRRQTIDTPGSITDGIDETALIEDPEAMKMLHDALERVAKGEIPVVESTAREIGPGTSDAVPVERPTGASPRTP